MRHSIKQAGLNSRQHGGEGVNTMFGSPFGRGFFQFSKELSRVLELQRIRSGVDTSRSFPIVRITLIIGLCRSISVRLEILLQLKLCGGYEEAISSKFVVPGYHPVRNGWNAERL
jgi:hypothetical protein